jgi:hypothetical protein
MHGGARFVKRQRRIETHMGHRTSTCQLADNALIVTSRSATWGSCSTGVHLSLAAWPIKLHGHECRTLAPSSNAFTE